jgi:monoamine oxidase
MSEDDTEVVIVGGGAAGIAAARRLREAGVDYLLVEARDRLGGRGWTVPGPVGEACSEHDFSTAHGAYHTGIAAAEQAIAARRKPA